MEHPRARRQAHRGPELQREWEPSSVDAPDVTEDFSPTSGEGFGEPDDVVLPSEDNMLLRYVILATAVTAVAVLIPDGGFGSVPDLVLLVLNAVLAMLAARAWIDVFRYPYQAIKQRPKAWRRVRNFFRNQP